MMNLNFEQGSIEYCKLNGKKRMFEWVERGAGEREGEYAVRWDDGVVEWAYGNDIERWLSDHSADIPVEKGLVRELNVQLQYASIEELRKIKLLISGNMGIKTPIWDQDFNNPEHVYYKMHDVCTDIREGHISDSEGADRLLEIFNGPARREEHTFQPDLLQALFDAQKKEYELDRDPLKLSEMMMTQIQIVESAHHRMTDTYAMTNRALFDASNLYRRFLDHTGQWDAFNEYLNTQKGADDHE